MPQLLNTLNLKHFTSWMTWRSVGPSAETTLESNNRPVRDDVIPDMQSVMLLNCLDQP